MNRVMNQFRMVAVFGAALLCAAFLGSTSAAAADEKFVSKTAEIDGVALHYTTGGHGPAVILLHGYAETSRMWAPILPEIGRASCRERV